MRCFYNGKTPGSIYTRTSSTLRLRDYLPHPVSQKLSPAVSSLHGSSDAYSFSSLPLLYLKVIISRICRFVKPFKNIKQTASSFSSIMQSVLLVFSYQFHWSVPLLLLYFYRKTTFSFCLLKRFLFSSEEILFTQSIRSAFNPLFFAS